MSSVADTPDWSTPSGTPAQLIGKPIGPSGTLLLGSDGTDARAILTDSMGRIKLSGGAGAAGTNVTHAAPFAYNSSGILTGHTLVFNDGYTVAADDWLVDAWVEIDTAWNGTTPWGDYGQFAGGDVAGFLYGSSSLTPLDMTNADSTGNYGFEEVLIPYNNTSRLSTVVAVSAVAGLLEAAGATSPYSLQIRPGYSLERGFQSCPMKFTNTDPMKFLVSQTGFHGGASPGATAGAGVFYMTTATPA